jgi:hypothetical protein
VIAADVAMEFENAGWRYWYSVIPEELTANETTIRYMQAGIDDNTVKNRDSMDRYTWEKNGTCYLEDGEVKKILRENEVSTRAGKSDSWVSIFPFEQTMLEIAESYQTARNGVAQGDFKAFKKVIISNTGCGDGPGWHYFTVALGGRRNDRGRG